MNRHNELTDRLFQAILSLRNVEECYAFFEDICTIKEILDISQRLQAADLLSQKYSFQQISQDTGMSTATISRVNKCLVYGNGGYQMVLERLARETGAENP